jgi:hypothetical protein
MSVCGFCVWLGAIDFASGWSRRNLRDSAAGAVSYDSARSLEEVAVSLRCLLSLAAVWIAATTLIYAAPLSANKLVLATAGDPTTPSVAYDKRVGFVVTWQERADGGARLLFAVIDDEGKEQRRGQIAAGQNWFVNWADFPSLAVLDNGDWVTFWLEKSAGSTYAYDIRLVRSQDQGRTWSPPVTPHRDRTPTEHGFVSLVPEGGDKVLVVWLDGRKSLPATPDSSDHASHASHSNHETEGTMTLRSAILDRRGRISEEFELDEGSCSCCQTDAARTAQGTWVVYRDRTEGEIRDIAVVSRSHSGSWSLPKVLHADNWRIEGCPVNGAAVAVNGARRLVVWPTGVTGSTTTHYQLAEPTRIVKKAEIQPGTQMLGRVDAVPWGSGFLVSWIGTNDTQSGLLVSEITAAGTIAPSLNVAPVLMTRLSGNPRMASAGERAMIVWMLLMPSVQNATDVSRTDPMPIRADRLQIIPDT